MKAATFTRLAGDVERIRGPLAGRGRGWLSGDMTTDSTAVTRALAGYSAGLALAKLPPDVVARARLLFLDLVGSIVRAPSELPSPAVLRSTATALGFGGGTCRVFGDSQTWTPAGAALLNSAYGHALDFDDTHAPSTLHPGAPVIPAAFAAAQMAGASGADLIAGIVAGYDVTCRIGMALPAGEHYARGFHPTATCGAFGAAAAAGRVLGLTGDQIASAFGIALSQSAGSLQFLANGAWTKPFQVGWAASAGLTAAVLARQGYLGPAEALEGKHGFLRAYAPAPRPALATANLGNAYELMATGVKPYPSCRYGHAGIDAAMKLRTQHQLAPSDIEKVTYGLSNAGMLMIGAPADAKRNPKNTVDAQFSAPFVLAAALLHGEVTWSSYSLLESAAMNAMIAKIDCVFDPEIEAEFPANMSGRVTVVARGRTYSEKAIVPYGEPANFMSEDRLLAKFFSLARPAIGPGCEELADCILTLDRQVDLARLAAAAAPARHG